MTLPKQNIAIVVPCYKNELSADEKISIKHAERFLASHPRIMVRPEGSQNTLPGFRTVDFPSHHFASVSAYSKLLLSPAFYEAFSSYDYILIYQLDCLVFSDDLQSWCKRGYDYLGAPLFEKGRKPPRLSRVGNGGLSLRRVQAFLEVLNSPHIPSWSAALTAHLPDLGQFPLPVRWLKKMRVIRAARRGVGWYSHAYDLNEDLFWSDRARLFHPAFRIAPLEVALCFAFDAQPRACFEQNGHRLPFGAHAWAKWDQLFWQPYLLT